MTWFSLKRTLQSNLAFSIEILDHVNSGISKSNLHNPLKYSAVLLSISKTTQLCHQNIPLKKVQHQETVKYISALPRKLERIWQRPAEEIASVLLPLLHEQNVLPVWSSICKNDQGWIEFILSQQGVEQWRQQLIQLPSPQLKLGPAGSINHQQLWQLQAGYEQCYRWLTHHQPNASAGSQPGLFETTAPFQVPNLCHALIHSLVDTCDDWDTMTPSQLITRANRLVLAIDSCVRQPAMSASEVWTVSQWFEPARLILKQIVVGRLGHQLADHF